MRVLVVGAGASIEEARRANASKEFWPPVIANFARKMWDSSHNQFFNYWLPDYLATQGVDPGNDPTSRFIELAQDPVNKINVERLFEYCWINKGRKFGALSQFPGRLRRGRRCRSRWRECRRRHQPRRLTRRDRFGDRDPTARP